MNSILLALALAGTLHFGWYSALLILMSGAADWCSMKIFNRCSDRIGFQIWSLLKT